MYFTYNLQLYGAYMKYIWSIYEIIYGAYMKCASRAACSLEKSCFACSLEKGCFAYSLETGWVVSAKLVMQWDRCSLQVRLGEVSTVSFSVPTSPIYFWLRMRGAPHAERCCISGTRHRTELAHRSFGAPPPPQQLHPPPFSSSTSYFFSKSTET